MGDASFDLLMARNAGIDSVAAGSNPVRVALQPDERLLWVGNNAKAWTKVCNCAVARCN